jgi:hypothetical protein
VQRSAYIVRGYRYDCPEYLLERFDRFDGPRVCGSLNADYGLPKNENGVITGWPTNPDDYARPNTVRKNIKHIAIINKDRKGPCLARSTVPRLLSNEGACVAAWFDAWELAYEQCHSLPLIPVLDLRLDDKRAGWRWWSSRDAKRALAEIDKIIEDRSRNSQSRIKPIQLYQLESVSVDDARAWARWHFRRNDTRKKAMKHINEIFPNRESKLVMDEFAKRIEAAEWYEDFCEVYLYEA